MSDIEEKATTIANIETEEGPVEVIDDAEPTSTGIDASKINPPTNEDELVALVNVLGLDWKKIAEVLKKVDPKNVVAKKAVQEKKPEDIIISNIVKKPSLRRVQLRTIKDLAEKVMATYGPMESNTAIIRGNSKETMVTKYSKDGHTVLKGNTYIDPIEMSIQAEAENITSRVEREVGDGTSSAIEMAALIFEELCNIENSAAYRPYALMRSFQRVVDWIKAEIKSAGRPLELDDIYDISMISTNGNETIASQMKEIYATYGNDVYIDVRPNTGKEDAVKVYDGLTMDVGYSDVAYVNGADGYSTIRDARIYYFLDPIDTREMISLFEKIIIENIMLPMQSQMDPIPTVIVSPIMSRDMSSLMEQVVTMMYKYNEAGAISQKPPLLVITNLGVYTEYFNDISRLCGCKAICKYNDDKIYEADVEKGLAPTLDNVVEFYGMCDEVSAGVDKTKFIGPHLIYQRDENDVVIKDDNGDPVYSETYNIVLASLEGELVNAQNNKADANTIGGLKRRINSLKANMIDFFVGGMSISDRDAKRDLVEDCVLSCRSAAKNGVGFAANFEGYMASMTVWGRLKHARENGDHIDTCDELMALIIASAYGKMQEKLYSTYESDPVKVDKIITDGVEIYGNPFNLATEKYDGKVITSIDTDIVILDSIAKIITLMFTANQAMLPSPVGNKYLND
jgi:hypothetical protein